MDDKQRQEALQALNLLDSVAALAPVARSVHVQTQQAVAVIRKTLTKEGPLEDA